MQKLNPAAEISFDLISHPFFEHGENQHPVRIFGTPELPWFCNADVCVILGISNSRQCASYLEPDEKITVATNDGVPISLTDTPVITNDGSLPNRGNQLTLINESGLYSLIFRSRKPQAKAFRRWVTGEVLPTLRQRGSYSMPGVADSTAAAVEAILVVVFQGMQGTLDALASRLDAMEQRQSEKPPTRPHLQVLPALTGKHAPLAEPWASICRKLALDIIASPPNPGSGPQILPLPWIYRRAEELGLLPAHYASFPPGNGLAALARMLNRGWRDLRLPRHRLTRPHGLRKSAWVLTAAENL